MPFNPPNGMGRLLPPDAWQLPWVDSDSRGGAEPEIRSLVYGIVADRRMVDHVRDESPLEDVLRENNVDYLIVSFAATRVKEEGGCYEITQPDPEWAGRRTAKMRGEICSPPTERFVTPAGTHTWSVFPAIETLIWNVRDARWKARRMNNQTRRAISVRTKAGERVTYKIGPQNDAGAIARRLTLQIHRMVRGDTATETIGRLIIQPVELPRYQAASPSLVAYV